MCNHKARDQFKMLNDGWCSLCMFDKLVDNVSTLKALATMVSDIDGTDDVLGMICDTIDSNYGIVDQRPPQSRFLRDFNDWGRK